jgi:hypothetical protein
VKYSALSTEATCAQYWDTLHSVLRQRVLNTVLNIETQCTQYWGNVCSILRHSAISIEATCAQYWGTVHSVLRQCVLNTEAQCTQYWGNVCSILRHSSLNIEAMCAQHWDAVHSVLRQRVLNTEAQCTQYWSNVCSILKHNALNQSTCTALLTFPSQSIPPKKNQAQSLFTRFLVLRALILNITVFCVSRSCSLIDWYLPPKQNDWYLSPKQNDWYLPPKQNDWFLPPKQNDWYLLSKQNEVTSKKTIILISTQVLQLKWNFRFKVATAKWTSQSAKLYGIIKWLRAVLVCFWHPVISDCRTQIGATTAVKTEADHPKWGKNTFKVSFHFYRTLHLLHILGVQQLNKSQNRIC